MYLLEWVKNYGHDSPWRNNPEAKEEKQNERKEFQMKCFLNSNYIGKEIYIKCTKPLQSKPQSGNIINDSFTNAIESGIKMDLIFILPIKKKKFSLGLMN